ncbi:MAG: hypothetical protein U1E25_15630 [Methylocystis sp.]
MRRWSCARLKALSDEHKDIDALLADEAEQWKTIAWQVRELKKSYGPQTPIGKRRATFEDAPEAIDLDLAEAMIEREPVTIVVSERAGFAR